MKETLINGAIGTGSSVFGVAMSLARIELGLRIASLLVGLVVGILTAVSIWRGMKKKG